jgi:predicted kinase
MSKIIMMIGLPGSGKSSYAKEIIKMDSNKNTLIISRDNIREMVAGSYEAYSDYYKRTEPLVMAWVMQMIDTAMHAGRTVVLDETNINTRTRSYWIDAFRNMRGENGKPIQIMGLYVETDIELCKERRRFDTKNSSTDWDSVIDRMVSQFEVPTEDEFDNLTIFN